LSTEIGDFGRLGLGHVTLEDFVAGRVTESTLAEARLNNDRILETMTKQSSEGAVQLLKTASQIASANNGKPYAAKRVRGNVLRQIRGDRNAQLRDRIPRIKGKVMRMLGFESARDATDEPSQEGG